MRLLSCLSLLVAALLLLAKSVPPVYASDVLLPSNNTTGPQPNMGLVPLPETPTAPDTGTSIDTPPADTTPTDTKKDTNLPLLSPSSSQNATAHSSSAKTPMTPSNLPTTILQVPADADQTLAMLTGRTAHSLSVDLTTGSLWEPRDIETVNTRLGVAKERVASLCQLSLGGVLVTDQSEFILGAGYASHMTGGYNGSVKTAVIQINALCPMTPLPPNHGFISQVGSSYAVSLGSISCPAPSSLPTPQHLSITYNGGASQQCVYQ